MKRPGTWRWCMQTLALLATALLLGCGKSQTPPASGQQDAAVEQATAVTEQPQSSPAPEDVAAVPADAERSASGLAWRVLVPGTGTQHPESDSRVEVHYTGWTSDGEMFDSSRVRGQTATFPLNRVIAGWTEGVQLMVAGEQRRFWIPPELAYANSSRPGAPQGLLVFDVELIDIKD